MLVFLLSFLVAFIAGLEECRGGTLVLVSLDGVVLGGLVVGLLGLLDATLVEDDDVVSAGEALALVLVAQVVEDEDVGQLGLVLLVHFGSELDGESA